MQLSFIPLNFDPLDFDPLDIEQVDVPTCAVRSLDQVQIVTSRAVLVLNDDEPFATSSVGRWVPEAITRPELLTTSDRT